MQEEGDVVPGDVEVAVVDLGSPWHLIELLGGKLRAVGIVQDDAVCVFVADTENLVEGFAVGIFDNGEVKLATADEVDGRTLIKCLTRRSGDGRPDEGDFDGRGGFLDEF